jgi:enamine deaminase RidA (YjgF/YER057c/UK114 family)
MSFEVINPESLGAPKGWSHGMLAPTGGRVLFVAGQTAVAAGGFPTDEFVAQFAAALRNVLAVVRAAGGGPEHVGRMTVYVTDMEAYRSNLKQLGAAYREQMGYHFPAMALVEVTRLVSPEARVEIEATAVV